MSRILDRINNDPRVGDISDEREWDRKPAWSEENGDGFWIYTAAGYCVESGAEHDEASCIHATHEDSPTEAYKRFREQVQECDCYRCEHMKARAAR
jgi:hypothetical protein